MDIGDGKKYYTHDNGDKPFLVIVKNNTVGVYKLDGDNVKDYKFLVKRYKNVKHVFIGNNYNKKFSPNKGNSILLQVTKSKYVFIGDAIYDFKIKDDEIIKYFSDIGNNDVPYPIGLGKKYVYFMIDNVRMPIDAFRPNIIWHDAYSDFYGYSKDKWYKDKYGNNYGKKFIKNRRGFDTEPLNNFTQYFSEFNMIVDRHYWY